ncbi:hypothetical protein HY750_00865 [Candidatus Kuenenbacteria bacterium]|nr:hypothetical protein [Candidatus Kuenenbacteria bacterium]
MKKILLTSLVSVFVFSVAFSAMAVETKVIPKTKDTIKAKITTNLSDQYVPCIKTAVEKRETAIIVAVDTYTSAIKKSFETRKAALLAAWSIVKQKERNIAIKAAFAQHRIAKRSAMKLYKVQRLSAWNKFIKARITCKAPATGEDMSVDMNFND